MARALAWHARGHRFDPDILHFADEFVPLRSLTSWHNQDYEHEVPALRRAGPGVRGRALMRRVMTRLKACPPPLTGT